jgi:hypothetical protein
MRIDPLNFDVRAVIAFSLADSACGKRYFWIQIVK